MDAQTEVDPCQIRCRLLNVPTNIDRWSAGFEESEVIGKEN